MGATVIAACIAAGASICSALIAAWSARCQRKHDEQELAREQMNLATAQAMLALLDATDVSMLALEGGHLNGNVEDARGKISRAREDYQSARSRLLSHLV